MKTFKQISIIGLGDIFGSGIALLFWFYLAATIDPAEYGQIHYIISIGTILSTFTLLGTGNTLIVYIAKNKDVVIALLNFSLILGGGILITSILFNFFNIGLLVFGIIIFMYGFSRDLAKKDFKKYSINIILQKSSMAALAFLGLHFFGIEGVIYGVGLSYFIYFRYIIQDVKNTKLSYNQFIINFNEIKKNKNFIFTNYFFVMTHHIATQADKLLIVPILGVTILGNYSLALQIVTILTIMPSIIFKFILPYNIEGKISKTLKRYTILLSFVFVFLGVVISPILIPIFFEKYTEVIEIIQIISFSVIPITINQFYFAGFLSKENGKTPLIGGVISSSIMLSGIIFLGSIFEERGIAITHVLSFSSLSLFYYWSQKKNRS
jgi:O-antigen/teichoic acid export membrane protein